MLLSDTHTWLVLSHQKWRGLLVAMELKSEAANTSQTDFFLLASASAEVYLVL